jgi:hypothetical protein
MNKEIERTEKRIIEAIEIARKRFVAKAKAEGRKLVVWRDGKIVEVDMGKLKTEE